MKQDRLVILFLSIQAQDFIEDRGAGSRNIKKEVFLSIQAQDFIEDFGIIASRACRTIPEHSSSGLH